MATNNETTPLLAESTREDSISSSESRRLRDEEDGLKGNEEAPTVLGSNMGYLLTTTSFQPLYGKLSDIFGRKEALLFAYSVFGLGCLGCGLAGSMSELIAARAFAGIGGGGMTTVVSIMLSDLVPLRSRGTWQGILNIIYASGAATGAPLGGMLADSIGWRW
ncbi:hypothetical protein RUND412_011677 [Rhizina undulata]